MTIFLSDQERERFALYCAEQAKQHVQLAKQVLEIPSPIMEKLAARERTKAKAFIMVSAEIDPANWEQVSIGKPSEDD